MSWKQEFDRRLRIVCGAPEGVDLEVRLDYETYGGYGGCETCDPGPSVETSIDVHWIEGPGWGGHKHVEFSDMGDLIRQVDAVDDLVDVRGIQIGSHNIQTNVF